MPRGGFVNPGAAAGNAIQEFLAQRELQNRQRMIDELTQQRQAEDMGMRQRQMALQEGQEARIGASQRETQANLEQEREFDRATVISRDALPGDSVDAATRDLLTRHGRGGQVQTTPGIIQQGPELESADSNQEGIPTYGVLDIPEQSVMRGGSQYMSARAAEDARRAQATEANTARAAQAEEARLGREEEGERNRVFQGTQNDLSRANTRAIAGMGASIRQDAAQGKLDEKKKVDDLSRANAQRAGQDTIDVLDQLATFNADGTVTLKPGAANLFGARMPGASYVPGSQTADASAALNRLKSRTMVDLLNEMKSQSRTGATGFGSMNEKEFGVLETGATQLGSSFISDESAAAELKRIYDVANRARTGGAGATQAGSKKTFPNGRTATFDGQGWVAD